MAVQDDDDINEFASYLDTPAEMMSRNVGIQKYCAIYRKRPFFMYLGQELHTVALAKKANI